MKSLIHSVLGTDYEVLIGCRDEINIAEENMGECRVYAKKILVCTDQGDCTEEELRVKVQEIVAHEFLAADNVYNLLNALCVKLIEYVVQQQQRRSGTYCLSEEVELGEFQ